MQVRLAGLCVLIGNSGEADVSGRCVLHFVGSDDSPFLLGQRCSYGRCREHVYLRRLKAVPDNFRVESRPVAGP
jgi:hypothetical protein